MRGAGELKIMSKEIEENEINLLDIDPSKIDSPVLRQLIDEVRNDISTGEIVNYNRMHNRHNRSGGGWGRRSYTPEELEKDRKRAEREKKISDDISKGLKDKVCKICGLPLDKDNSFQSEINYFLLFGVHKKCAYPEIEGSEK